MKALSLGIPYLGVSCFEGTSLFLTLSKALWSKLSESENSSGAPASLLARFDNSKFMVASPLVHTIHWNS